MHEIIQAVHENKTKVILFSDLLCFYEN